MGIERISVAGAGTTGAAAPGLVRLVVLTILLATVPLVGSAQDGATEDELIILRARRASLENELERLASERESVVNRFETVDVELALRRQQLTILDQRNDVLARQRAGHEVELERLEAAFVESRGALRARVGSLYRVGPLSYDRLLLAADTAANALIAYQIMTYLAARDRDLLRSVRSTVRELDQTRASLAETEQQLASVAADTEAAATALAQQQQERRRLLAAIDREAEAQQAALAAAQRSESRLGSTMRTLSRSAEASAPVAFASARGQLEWPVSGAVVGEVGRRRHPIYDTYTVSRGIEIEGDQGDPVAAVFDGRVVFADWYSGYGLMVIVDHRGGYFSLYGHLNAIGVRVNQSVKGGDIVGEVGDTGSLIGPNLYFEVRERTDALNPLNWLQAR